MFKQVRLGYRKLLSLVTVEDDDDDDDCRVNKDIQTRPSNHALMITFNYLGITKNTSKVNTLLK